MNLFHTHFSPVEYWATHMRGASFPPQSALNFDYRKKSKALEYLKMKICGTFITGGFLLQRKTLK